jgi:ribonuclease D
VIKTSVFPISDMTITYIDCDEQLSPYIEKINSQKEFAIDLEFDKNRYRYGFNLCLVQICINDQCLLIDPLSDRLDITSIYPALETDKIQKITFAFGEDIRLLHSLGCYPKNIYDLSIATSLLNYPQKSLVDYISEILNWDTSKSSQQSNWFKRPLSQKQMKYAAEDVLHLSELKNVLESEARDKKITDWIEEENALFNSLDYAGLDDNQYLKEKDKNDMSEVEWHLYQILIEFREETAKKWDKPSYQILHKNLLKEIVKDRQILRTWTDKKGIFKGIKTDAFKKQLVHILKAGIQEARELGLSENRPAEKPLCKKEIEQEQEMRNKINRVKKEYFVPIKNKIAEDYGKEAASFILSNRIITNMITGNVDNLECYKKNLISEYANELNLESDPLSVLDEN